MSRASSRSRFRTRRWLAGPVAALLAVSASGMAAHASASGLLGGLLGGLLCPATNTLGITSAGWDDGATTPPSTMAEVDQAIGASRLQAGGITGSGVGVALIDSGVVPVQGLTTPGKVINGPDLSLESQDRQVRYLDTYGHGTHMAGIIAGWDGPGGSFTGVAPGAHLVVLKVASHDEGAADVSQVIAAIDWVVQHRNDPGLNIRVLNLSYGTASLQGYAMDPLAFAVENAWNHGIVTVVSGGNDGTSRGQLNDPAFDPHVIAVGAADLNGTNLLGCTTVAPFSSRSFARPVDVIAPGVSIESLRDPGSAIDRAHPGAVVDTRFFRGSGTSQAAAVVSGAAALLLQARPDLTPDQVKSLLNATAVPLALLDTAAEGHGMINVYAAARASLGWSFGSGSAPALGTGSINQARGGSYISIDGMPLTGEQDLMERPWDGAAWTAETSSASAWSGGTWNSAVWAGGCWCASSWAGSAWSSAQWTGPEWSGYSASSTAWSGAQWSGAQWSGAQWSDGEWSGAQWSDAEWL